MPNRHWRARGDRRSVEAVSANQRTEAMKLYRVTVVLAVLLLAWTTLSAVAGDDMMYAHCDPLCLEYRQVGGEHVAFAVDADGRFLGMAKLGAIGPLLTGAGLGPMRADHGEIRDFRIPLARDKGPLGRPYSGVVRPDYAGMCGGDFELHASRETTIVETAKARTIYTTTTVRCGGASGHIVHIETTTIVIPKGG